MTETPDTEFPALDLAITQAQGVSRLAALLSLETGKEIRQNVVSNWRMRGVVPRDYLAAIERATGVRCERFDNTVQWVRAGGRVTHYIVPVLAAA